MKDLTTVFENTAFRSEDEINAYVKDVYPGLLIDILNTAKAAGVMGSSYEDFFNEAYSRTIPFKGEVDVSKVIEATLIKYLIASGKGNFKQEEGEDVSGRIRWDKWYLNMCEIAAANSKCLSRHIGAIVVVDKSIVSTGYNGPPRGVGHCGTRHQRDPKLLSAYKSIDKFFDERIEVVKCPRQILGFKSGEGLEWCVAGHGERNALINAAREGIKVKGAKLYMNCGIPCSPCLVEIINAGIEEIIVTKLEYYDLSAEYLLKESGLKYRIYEHLK